MTVPWIRVQASLCDSDVWKRQPDRDLWLWLLFMAKRHRPEGEVRFSYGVAADALAYCLGGTERVVTYSRRQVKRALMRLVKGRHASVPGPDLRRGQGGGQGYFVVKVCNWERYQRAGPAAGERAGKPPVKHLHAPGQASAPPSLQGTLHPSSNEDGAGDHREFMAALHEEYIAVFGADPPFKLARWTKTVKLLRERGETPAKFRPAVRAFYELARQRNLAMMPDSFLERYDGLAQSSAPRWLPGDE